MPDRVPSSVAVIIISENEELNIIHALASCRNWAREVFVVDSFSRDRTTALAESYGASVFQHQYIQFADQRNWAMANLPISAEWVLFLDADEKLTEGLREEIDDALARLDASVSAVRVSFEFYFLGRRLRWANRHPARVRLIRKGRVKWSGEGAREYAAYSGEAPLLKNRIIHDDRKGLMAWIARQATYADREADVLVAEEHRLRGSGECGLREEKNKRLRRIWNGLPICVRPFLYFLYRYILRLGFLDGRAGFIYLFFQSLWMRMLIDARYLERKQDVITATAEEMKRDSLVGTPMGKTR
jgi:glycosyltransferase involved in cell wall biosynthesis